MNTIKAIMIISFLAIFACKPVVLDAIADECLLAESAHMKVNDTLQVPKSGSIGGAPLYYLFGAKPNGEWSINIESDDYELALMVAELLPLETFIAMDDKAQNNFVAKSGKYSLLERKELINNLLFQDFKRNILLEREHLTKADVSIEFRRNANCNFVVVAYTLAFKNKDLQWEVEGTVQSAFTKKNIVK